MSTIPNRPIVRRPSLITPDNRDFDLVPYDAVMMSSPGGLPAAANDRIASFRDYIATSRSQRKHHPLLRGSEAISHRKRSKDDYTGEIPMTRLQNKLLSGTSMLELDALSIIDFKVENMIDAVTQPDWVDIEVAGKQSTWLPDILINRLHQRTVFVEVKPISAVHPRTPKPGMSKVQLEKLARSNERVRKVRLRIAGMRQFAVSRGAEFWLLTEHEIRLQPQLFNAETMWIGLNSFIGEEAVTKAATLLRNLPTTMTVELLAAVVPELAGSEVNLACVLDRMGAIRLDRNDFFSLKCAFENRLSKHI